MAASVSNDSLAFIRAMNALRLVVRMTETLWPAISAALPSSSRRSRIHTDT
jgi:hypothetical protein